MKTINALFLVLVIACSAHAASAATLEGTVLDPSGKAVSGARVTLSRSLVVVGVRQTDAQGEYRFDGLQEGVHQITASARGLAGAPVEVNVGAEGAKKDIELKISATSSQVVVSASLGAALTPALGTSVSLVDAQEIETRGVQNAFEAIRNVPGIELNQNGHRGSNAEIYIRGGSHKDNAIMVDGIPMNEFGGPFYFMSSIPSDGIERIELARGPQSALYGPNAVTGVVNIITRRGEGPPRFTALAEGGSYSTRRFATSGSGLTRGLNWAYSLSRLDSEGVVDNDSYRNQGALFSLGYARSGRRQIDFRFMGNANSNGTPGPYGSDPNHLYQGIDRITRGKQNMFAYQLAYTEQLAPRVRQATTVSLATNDLFYHSPYGDSMSDNLRGIFNTRTEIALSGNDTLSAGFEFNREQVRNTYIADHNNSPFLLQRASFGYFVENRWSPTDRFYLIAGMRIDNLRTAPLPGDGFSRPAIPANSIVKVNPRISASYLLREEDFSGTLGGTRLHGSFGTGIRPPDGFDLAFTNNPGLKPERSISFDAGVEQAFFSSRATVDATYFFNRFEDQIVSLGGTLANLSSYRSDNLKNSRAQGIELSFKVHPIDSLELGGEYTFMETSVLALDGSSGANEPFRVGQQLQRRPRHSAGYNITWSYRGLTLNTSAHIRGSVLDMDPSYGLSACSYGMQCLFTNKGYTRVDAGFSYRLPHGVELYGRVYNLLNKSYEEAFGYPALPANFMAGMRFAFPAE